MITVRPVRADDATSLASFIVKLDHESEYLLYEPGERTGNIDNIRRYLGRMKQDKSSIMFVAQNNEGQMVGFACGEVPHLIRMSHIMNINIGILSEYQGQGTGKRFIEALVDHARSTGIIRIEATIVKDNVKCLGLFKKNGFAVEGIKSNALVIDNVLRDVCMLSKLNNNLPEEGN